MADLDTQNKRSSALGVGLSFLRLGPVPDTGNLDDAGERQIVSYAYALSDVAPIAQIGSGRLRFKKSL